MLDYEDYEDDDGGSDMGEMDIYIRVSNVRNILRIDQT